MNRKAESISQLDAILLGIQAAGACKFSDAEKKSIAAHYNALTKTVDELVEKIAGIMEIDLTPTQIQTIREHYIAGEMIAEQRRARDRQPAGLDVTRHWRN